MLHQKKELKSVSKFAAVWRKCRIFEDRSAAYSKYVSSEPQKIQRLQTTAVEFMGRFSSPVLLHYTLPVLMLILIVGTIAQKYIGLYDATQIFFANPILWAGPIPLPGMPIILAIISLNLAGKLIFKSPWTICNAGILLTHIGALLLMVGGLLTATFSEEGYLDLPIGSSKSTVSDYHIRELVITKEDKEIFSLNWDKLKAGEKITHSQIPFTLEILSVCRDCEIIRRANAEADYHGMAQHMEIVHGKPKINNEENMSGITFRVSGSKNETQNGVYVVLEDIPQDQPIDETQIIIRKIQRELPFSVELLDFKREMHPSTEKPKSYQSVVRIHDNGLEWQSTISMNAPLRYKGYTFFQSSFIATPRGDISVLAVVWNVGRTFPYIASLAMCIGILLHLILRARR